MNRIVASIEFSRRYTSYEEVQMVRKALEALGMEFQIHPENPYGFEIVKAEENQRAAI